VCQVTASSSSLLHCLHGRPTTLSPSRCLSVCVLHHRLPTTHVGIMTGVWMSLRSVG